MNHYEVLGVVADCSMEVLRQKYHRLLLEYHPDKSKCKDASNQKRLEEIQNAYRVLSDAELRLKYDQEQQRRYLHTLPHTNLDANDDDEYTCRCGTILPIDRDADILECPNCSMRIELTK